jgi:hypothetical protein
MCGPREATVAAAAAVDAALREAERVRRIAVVAVVVAELGDLERFSPRVASWRASVVVGACSADWMSREWTAASNASWSACVAVWLAPARMVAVRIPASVTEWSVWERSSALLSGIGRWTGCSEEVEGMAPVHERKRFGSDGERWR